MAGDSGERFSGPAIGAIAAGGLLVFAGIKGYSLGTTIQDIVQGKNPLSQGPPVLPIVPATIAAPPAGGGGGSGGSTGTGQAAGSTTAAGRGSGGTSASGGKGGTTGLSGNKAIVNGVAATYGWGTGTQWQDLVNVINAESGFNNTAQNPTSTAYGMFQFLDSTWATVGARKTSNPLAQAVAGMKYIKSRYGSPSAAWAHEQQFHWY